MKTEVTEVTEVTGVLFIHGFTGGTYEVQPLINYIKNQTDWLVEVPTLPGHGVTLDLGNTSAESWMMEAELAMRRLQKKADRVIIVGFSMGGLIALYLSLRYRIDRLVLLSAAAKYISPRVLLDDVRAMLTESITKNYAPNTFRHLTNYKLTHTPLLATFEFLRIVRMVRPYYGKITVPVCIVQGKRDAIVPFSTAQHLHDVLGSTEKKMIESEVGQHHICYSLDSAEWFEELLLFMKKG